jgi:hypothetical protein
MGKETLFWKNYDFKSHSFSESCYGSPVKKTFLTEEQIVPTLIGQQIGQ